MPRNDSPFSRPAAAKASAGIVTWCFEVIVVQPRGRTLTDLLISNTVEGLHLIRKAVVAPNSRGFRDKLCSSAPQPSLGDCCREGSRGDHGAKTATGIVTPTNELSSIGGYSPTSKRYSPGSRLSMVNSKVPPSLKPAGGHQTPTTAGARIKRLRSGDRGRSGRSVGVQDLDNASGFEPTGVAAHR